MNYDLILNIKNYCHIDGKIKLYKIFRNYAFPKIKPSITVKNIKFNDSHVRKLRINDIKE
jgi:hypothetical protein